MTRFPRYPDDVDYQTGTLNYYDHIAKHEKLMKHLAKRVWEYDKELGKRFAEWDANLLAFDDEVIKLLRLWVNDGTLSQIINEEIFAAKANTDWVQTQLNTKLDQTVFTDYQETINTELDTLETETAESLLDKLDLDSFTAYQENVERLYVNVLDYGAKGDGVTDDAAAIQRAINAGVGREVRFPDGVFLIKSIVTIPSHSKLILNKGTTIKRGSNINAMFHNASDGFSGGYTANTDIHVTGGLIDVNAEQFKSKCTALAFGHCRGITITDMRFIGMYQWHYVELNAVHTATVRDCHFDGHELDGIFESIQIDFSISETVFPWFTPYDNFGCENILVENNYFIRGTKGVGNHSTVAGSLHRNIRILHNTFRNMRGEAIEIRDVMDVLIRGNHVEQCWSGIVVGTSAENRSYGVTISENVISNAKNGEQGRGIHINARCDRVTIRGNHVNYAGRHGIGVDLSRTITIEGNTVQNSGRSGIWIFSCYDVHANNNHCNNNNLQGVAGSYDFTVGEENGVTATDVVIYANRAGTLGLMRSNRVALIHNEIGALTEGSVNLALYKHQNRIAQEWV